MRISRTRAATLGLLVPAAMALGMSADTSNRFLKASLDITEHNERMALCGVAEAAIVALTIYAWATGTKGPAYIAYAVVLAQAVPAFSVSGAAGGPVRVVLGPVLLALLLHLLLGLELRMSGQKSGGLLAAAMREMKERLTASLGIGRRGADSAAIARSRAADKVVELADQVMNTTPGNWRHRRLSASLAEQLDASRHGLTLTDAERAEAVIVSRVIRRKSVGSLAALDVAHDWSESLALLKREGERREKGDLSPVSPEGERSRGERREAGATPSVSPGGERREIEAAPPVSPRSERREVAGDMTMYAGTLLSHEPPAWASLSLRQAVAKADSLVPGLTARMLSDVLIQIGVKASPGSIRSTRSALRQIQKAHQS